MKRITGKVNYIHNMHPCNLNRMSTTLHLSFTVCFYMLALWCIVQIKIDTPAILSVKLTQVETTYQRYFPSSRFISALG